LGKNKFQKAIKLVEKKILREKIKVKKPKNLKIGGAKKFYLKREEF